MFERMSWFWTLLIFLSFISNNFSEARHQRNKLPSAVVVGTVYCDTCFHKDFPARSHFIAGASVAVECKVSNSRPNFRQEVKTNEHGQFKVHLPFSVSKHVKKIKGCSVKLLSSNEPYCAVAAEATSSSLHLKSRKEGTHIFSAGFFTFKPLKQPEICDQKPSINNNGEKLSPIANPNDPTFLPPIQDPPEPPALGGGGGGGLLPPLPRLPLLSPLPQLPRLPQIPLLPPVPNKETGAKTSQVLDKKVINQPMSFPFPFFPPLPLLPPPLIPPNPLLPPPSLLPPNPLLPPPSLLPPNPFQPPPSVLPPVIPTPPPSLFPPLLPTPPMRPPSLLPPFPGFTPSPPPPALPSFPIPLPPFPFQPTPGFPGVPPAQVSTQPKTGLP